MRRLSSTYNHGVTTEEQTQWQHIDRLLPLTPCGAIGGSGEWSFFGINIETRVWKRYTHTNARAHTHTHLPKPISSCACVWGVFSQRTMQWPSHFHVDDERAPIMRVLFAAHYCAAKAGNVMPLIKVRLYQLFFPYSDNLVFLCPL